MVRNNSSSHLYERVADKNTTIHRLLSVIVLSLLVSLLIYRISSTHEHGFPWLLALLCESWFTFYWVIIVSTRWNQVEYVTHQEQLLQQIKDLPRVDMFVTTADAVLEPPIITINTVLSLLAMDYPTDKLACYVSDDGCSPIILYSLIEAAKFAKLWLPFCKRYRVQVRAPFHFFSVKPASAASDDFHYNWQKMKDEYALLSQKVEEAIQNPKVIDLTGDFSAFLNAERNDHPTIIKVIWENKESGENGVPHLVYISREKRPKHPHHFKAGSMNVLTRVSGVMTNAPIMLNVDCDMFVNDPKIALHAMCLLLGFEEEREIGFVQAPQKFYDGLKDDPFGNQFIVVQKFLFKGLNAVQGPLYLGTGCFHRRKVIYGCTPNGHTQNKVEALEKQFGKSMKLQDSSAVELSGSLFYSCSSVIGTISCSIQAAYDVAACWYDYDTCWGKEIGWLYGTATEDVLTGLRIHSQGWRSIYIDPNPDAFLGCTPSSGPIALGQMKRWATGLTEILLSKSNPYLYIFTSELKLRACFGYSFFFLWPVRSIWELCYSLLPAFCLIRNTNFLPKVDEPAIFDFTALLISYELYNLWEHYLANQSIKAFWNSQKIMKIYATSAWLFGLADGILKFLGMSETMFLVTQKDSVDGDVDKTGTFTFDTSPIFIPGTTIVLVNLIGLATGIIRLVRGHQHDGLLVGELTCGILILLHYISFLRGLFAKGKYGIPGSTMCKSAACALVFCACAFKY